MRKRYFYNSRTGKIAIRKPRKTKRSPEAQRTLSIIADPQFSYSWLTGNTGPNSDLQGSLYRVIEMSRDMEEDAYGNSFFGLWERGVIGSQGYTLEARPLKGGSNPNREVDETNKRIIEEAWEDWKKPANCTVTEDMPWAKAKMLAERTYARDGGVLLKPLKGWDNEHNFAVQQIEADMIDFDFNLSGGPRQNRVIMGKEVNRFNKVVAFHLLGDHPGETYKRDGKMRTRVSAKGMIYRYHATRIGQAHGLPLMLSSYASLRHLGEYRNAEVIAARAHACAQMQIEDVEGEFAPYTEGDDAEHTDDDEMFEYDLEPGGIINVPRGKKATLTQPEHPNGNYPAFQKAVLMGAAAGGNIHYNQLAGDLTSVNYSSYKAGNVPQKQLFRGARFYNIETEEDPIFLAWLETQLVTGTLGIPQSAFNRVKPHVWHCEKSESIEPEKETRASILALGAGLTSPRRVMAEMHNTSPETVFKEMEEDLAKMKALGINPNWDEPEEQPAEPQQQAPPES